MAAPAVYTRGTPLGAAMQSGFRSKFTIGTLLTFSIWEFELTPGTWEGGEPIKQSTFFNVAYHTKLPQTLIDVGAFRIKGKYDPDVFKAAQLPLLINRNGGMTALFPVLGTLSVYGWLRTASFGVLKHEELPTVEIMCEVSNWDPVNRVEAGPNWVDGYTGTADT